MLRARRAAAGALLVVLALCLASNLKPPEVAWRWRLFLRSISGSAPSSVEGIGFSFDPDYAAFLEDLASRVPPEASVAVVVPAQPDPYFSHAVYGLAPRRVVDRTLSSEADYVATYRTELSHGAGGEPISHGTLRKR